jgi:ABC-type dipeptide/oligopeptide/nickel transport system permease subunit
MSQSDAQLTLLGIAAVWSWGLLMAHANDFRPSHWWWLVPCILTAPAFAHVFVRAVLG